MESSRIFVRGLPPKFTEGDVRDHFSRFPVTDVKFFPHRRFGYVGYKSAEDAQKAIKYFNKSFINLSKINVEIAKPFSDKDLPKSRRQQRKDASAPKDDHYVLPQDNSLKRKRDETEQDPELKEFLEVMQPPSKMKTWANDQVQTNGKVIPTPEAMAEVAVPEGESDDEYQTIVKKPKATQEMGKVSVDPQPLPNFVPGTDNEEEAASADQDMPHVQEEKEQAPVTDDDWLRSRTNRTLDLVEDDEDPSPPKLQSPSHENVSISAAQTHEPEHVQSQEHNTDSGPSEEEKIRDTGRLYLRNLHYDVTEDNLRDYLSQYSSLEEIHIPLKKSDGKGKGFAFVQFKDPEDAVQAYLAHDATIFQGRLLHIIGAKTKKENKMMDEFEIAKLPLKKQKEVKRKQEAAKSTFNWNSLYINADAVMSEVATRMGVNKAELLDPTSSSAAVKQAHAETAIIQETKSYFAQHGVDLEAFKRSARGDTAILVKNIPRGVSANELKDLFSEHGTITRFLMPPAGMTAIFEFSNAAQARSAFTSLSYRKMKDSILYLEKAPRDLFTGSATDILQTLPSSKPGTKLSATDLLADAPPPEAANTATLYVRNLNFSTTTDKLAEAFKPLSGFRTARVKTKQDPKRGVLSMGFGFVEFNSADAANAALKTMNNYSLDGHRLELRASHKGADAAEERRNADAAMKAGGTKIIIKNLPFEASKKDVRALFSAYGTLRSVRVPKKFNSSSRGFAFCDFTTKRDAGNAMSALSNTHLLGRKLVLSWAETESEDAEKELEKMQQKVGAQANKVALQKLTSGGRKKFTVAGNEEDGE